MATLGTEGFVLGLGFCERLFQRGVGRAYCRRRTVALVAVIDIVLHSLRNLLKQEGSLKPQFHDGSLDTSLARADDIVAVFDLVDAPLQLDALAVVGSFDGWRERGVRCDGLHGTFYESQVRRRSLYVFSGSCRHCWAGAINGPGGAADSLGVTNLVSCKLLVCLPISVLAADCRLSASCPRLRR